MVILKRLFGSFNYIDANVFLWKIRIGFIQDHWTHHVLIFLLEGSCCFEKSFCAVTKCLFWYCYAANLDSLGISLSFTMFRLQISSAQDLLLRGNFTAGEHFPNGHLQIYPNNFFRQSLQLATIQMAIDSVTDYKKNSEVTAWEKYNSLKFVLNIIKVIQYKEWKRFSGLKPQGRSLKQTNLRFQIGCVLIDCVLVPDF